VFGASQKSWARSVRANSERIESQHVNAINQKLILPLRARTSRAIYSDLSLRGQPIRQSGFA
jgi:hypothetical protein